MDTKREIESNESNSRLKLPKYVLVGLVALQLVVIGLAMFLGKGKGGSGSDDGFPFPVWIAIFIPFIVSRGKKKRKQSRNFLWILVGLATLVLLASIFFLLKALL